MHAPKIVQVCPSPDTLDDLFLLRSGVAVQPRVSRHQSGRPDLPADGGPVELVDPEGVPLARIDTSAAESDHIVVTAQPAWLGDVSTRPFESLYLPPAEVRSETNAVHATTVVVDRPLGSADLDRFGDKPLSLLVLAGPSVEPSAHTLSAVRSAVTASEQRANTRVTAVPLNPGRAAAEQDLVAAVIDAYSPDGAEQLPTAHARELAGAGLVLFFTGLSGSGKSTVARAVRNRILEQDGRPITMLDGDVVRRHLSGGLGFSPADRETNIRRIGWVAAQIAHHGGLAICSPIAPYDSTRKEVRRTVRERGGTLVLVHIATPVEECERRDRKGLYAKARRGEIPHFTGISAPYEPPSDADLVLDTTGRPIADVRDDVLELLHERGLLDLGPTP